MENIKEEKQEDDAENIRLWLDSYNDLFSGFDHRSFSNKALSVDFLDELKRASKDKVEGLTLTLFVKEKLRDEKKEFVIKGRLKNHFRRHYEESKKEIKKILTKGLIFTIIGIILMFFATLILFKTEGKNILTSFLVVLMEPGGWFLFWEGLDLIVFEAKKENPRKSFYKKMTTSMIKFKSY